MAKPSSKAQQQLTPTQLRNARKRRAKQKAKRNNEGSTSHAKDPSLHYIACPTQTPIMQTARQFFATHQVPFSIHNNNESNKGWRTMCKLAVVPSSSDRKWALGLFAPQTHRVVPGTDQSVAHHPTLHAAVRCILACGDDGDDDIIPSAYTPDTNSGVRYLLLSLERSTQRVQLTLVVASSSGNKRKTETSIPTAFIDALVVASKVQWHSIWVHGNEQDRHCNAIVDVNGTWECCYQYDTKQPLPLCEHLGGNDTALPRIPLYFPPNVFRQANLDGFRYIVEKIRTVLTERKRQELSFRTLLELYGGVGTIGLHVADLFTEGYICSDANPYNPACFERSVDSWDGNCRCTYVPQSAHDMVPEYLSSGNNNNKADVIIVDPPRKGLEPTVVAALASTDPVAHTLVYVSCGFAAFERDCAVLLEHWTLDRAEGHVLFPGSDAIETLAIFRRKEVLATKRKGTMRTQITIPKRRRRSRR